MAFLAVQLVNLQVVRASHFQAISKNQLLRNIPVQALRAPIYDRNGQSFAMSVPTTQVVADDLQIKHPADEARVLSPLLGIPVGELTNLLTNKGGRVVLKENVSQDVASKIDAAQYPGVITLASSQRAYPSGSLAASVIGALHSDGTGSAGLEYAYQSMLAGQEGIESVFQSPYGVSLPTAHTSMIKRPIQGTGIELTLDAPLQFVTEQALGTELVDAHAVSGVAIVMNTQTGQILSMASMVNRAQGDARLIDQLYWPASTGVPGVYSTQNNLGVTQTYEPGSVFKVVPFSAALLAGRITPEMMFDVPDRVVIDGHVIHDAEEHGLLRYSATQILQYSSNIGTYEISKLIGKAGLLDAVQRLGFGQQTGLNFPGEESGVLVHDANFTATDLAVLPIGQADAVTPLQVLNAYNTIADGGRLLTPSLVRAKILADGTVVATHPPKPRQALPPSVAATLTKMLVRVVAGGTGTLAGVSGYTIAGKTGTAEIPYSDRVGYIPGAYNATFVGFAPAENPVLSMIVVLQRPTPVIYGGSVAAPVFSRVMGYALHRYGVPPSRGGASGGLRGGSVSFLQDVT